MARTYRRKLVLEPLERRCLLSVSSLVWPGIDAHLIYRPDAQGDRIPDFSDVGYMAGREAIPDVPAVVTVSPGAGDDTPLVQAAIDQVAVMPLDASGFRGAVLLEAGHYDIEGQISITTSGIVLRGEGRWTSGTVLHARGDDQRDLIRITGGWGTHQLHGSPVEITDKVVPVGARSFHVADVSGLRVGDSILVVRPSTAEWIHDIGMDQHDYPWTPGSHDLKFERTITRIDGNAITVDAPLTNSFEQQYGGGTVQVFTFPGRIRNVGVENLRAESDYDSDTDEDHSWSFVAIDRADNCWVRETKAVYFAYAHVKIGIYAKWVTVEDAINHAPKSQITGSRRYAFAIWGQQNLVTGCESFESRHDYVLQQHVAGPNVFHDSVAQYTHSDIGPHQRWATGALFDNIVSDGTMTADNHWNWGNGHGWAGANMVYYNCTADGYCVQSQPTTQNWVIGSIGEERDGRNGGALGQYPGTYDSHGTPVTPDSLYEAQSAERNALPGLDYREYWLGDIDGFTDDGDGSVDDVYVDPAWLAEIPGDTVGFDDLQNGRWVPFSFDFGLVPADRVVGATLALGMRNTGGGSADDEIYLDATSRSLVFSDLGWSVDSVEDGYVLDLGGHLDLLQDGLLNLAVHDDTAIDWAVLSLQVVCGQPTTYVDDSFTADPGDPIADADLGTSGDQPAVLGVNAFRTIAEAVAATASDGTIIVNGGAYAEAVALHAMQVLDVTGPDVPQTVTVDSLTGPAGTTLHLEGSVAFAGAGLSSIGGLNVRSNRPEPVTIAIPTGHTLTVTGDVLVGVPDTFGATTLLTVTGGGDLHVSDPSATVDIGLANSHQNSPDNTTTVDLSELGSFAADVDNFRVGYGSRLLSTLRLSDTANTIAANVLSVSNSAGDNGSPCTLTLGSGANTLHADTIEAGLSKGKGKITFASQAAGSPGTVTIRGRAGGTSAADITLGSHAAPYTGVTPIGTLDLRGHAADVMAGTLTMASRTVPGGGGATGTVYFNVGTFAVSTVDMATKSDGNNAAWATLGIGGGTFTVDAGGSFQLASHTGGGAAHGRLNVTGGTVTSHVDIIDGGGTSTTTITLDGGALDMTGHNIGGATPIDVLSFRSGEVRNVGQINNGAEGLTKTTGGTLTVAGTNTYTGITTVDAGTLRVTGTHMGGGDYAVLGGVLGGTGTIGSAVNVASGAAAAPGLSPGTLTVAGDITLDSGATLHVELNGDADYDQLATSGATRIVTLGGASLDISLGYTPAIGTTFTIINNDDSSSILSGELECAGEPLGDNETFVTAGTLIRVDYDAGTDGNDVLLTVVAPTLSVDMAVLVGARLNVDAPASMSLGLVEIDTQGNPASTLFAIRVGTDPNSGWLRFVDAGGRMDLFADGTGAEWHTADEWAGKRLRGLQPGASYTFHAKAAPSDLSTETPLVEVGTYTTNLNCDVNRSGLATALDYALIRAGELRGGELGVNLPWCLDVDGNGDLDSEDLGSARIRILNPGTPAPPVPGISTTAPLVTSASAEPEQRNSLVHFAALLSRHDGLTTRTLALDRDRDGDVDRDDLLAAGAGGPPTGGE